MNDIEWGKVKLDLPERHKQGIKKTACVLVGIADDTGTDLLEVIAEMERFIIEETKVGDALGRPVKSGRNGYTLKNGRLTKVNQDGSCKIGFCRLLNELDGVQKSSRKNSKTQLIAKFCKCANNSNNSRWTVWANKEKIFTISVKKIITSCCCWDYNNIATSKFGRWLVSEIRKNLSV